MAPDSADRRPGARSPRRYAGQGQQLRGKTVRPQPGRSRGGGSNLDFIAMFLRVQWTAHENQLAFLYKMRGARPHLPASAVRILTPDDS